MNGFFFRLTAAVLIVAACTAAMAVLVVGIALALGTTAHDWYAAGKVTLAEALIAVGFDEFARTGYRTADGETLRVSRYGLTIGEAWAVRARMLYMVADRALLGACTGVAVAVLWLWVRRAGRPPQPGWSNAAVRSTEMSGPYRPGGRADAGRFQPVGGRARIGLPVAPEAEFEQLVERVEETNPSEDVPTAESGAEGSAAVPAALPAAGVEALAAADASGQPADDAGAAPAKTEGPQTRTAPDDPSPRDWG